MRLNIRRRYFVRIITFALAAITVISSFAIINGIEAARNRRALNQSYQRALNDLADYMEKLEFDLSKGIYAGSPAQISALASRLWHQSACAKDCFGQLPLDTSEYENINKFLSQVGDYSLSLAKKALKNQKIEEDEYANLRRLAEIAEDYSIQISQISDQVDAYGTEVSLAQTVQNNGNLEGSKVGNFSLQESFQDMEESITSYPTLIYDGPFSDHIMRKRPAMTQGMDEIPKERAKKIAAEFMEVSESKIAYSNEETGAMPLYIFTSGAKTIAVTKNGGLIAYYVDNRLVNEENLNAEECIAKANAFLKKKKLNNLEHNYFNMLNGICTVNYAYVKDNITYYPDIIKISIARDTGEIISYDARGYIINHTDRKTIMPAVTESQARQVLSRFLSVEKASLAVIPSNGLEEILCYEFKCKGQRDEDILVYVNAITAAEEEILILIENENGTLTL